MRAASGAFYDGGKFLTTEELQKRAPCIFAESPNPHYTSKKFQHIPTSHMINILKERNWFPVTVQQANTRLAEKQGYQRHMLRFRNPELMRTVSVGEVIPELVVTNAHDGTSAYKIYAGLFRILCLNGLILSDAVFNAMTIRHFGFEDKDVIEATYKIIDTTPRAIDAVQEMKGVELSGFKRIEFAEKAAALRYPNAETLPIKPENLLCARRVEDGNTDLWHTFNVVQENLLKGGIMTIETKDRVSMRTRAVHNIRDVVKINRELWTLASDYGNIH